VNENRYTTFDLTRASSGEWISEGKRCSFGLFQDVCTIQFQKWLLSICDECVFTIMVWCPYSINTVTPQPWCNLLNFIQGIWSFQLKPFYENIQGLSKPKSTSPELNEHLLKLNLLMWDHHICQPSAMGQCNTNHKTNE